MKHGYFISLTECFLSITQKDKFVKYINFCLPTIISHLLQVTLLSILSDAKFVKYFIKIC